MAPLEFMFMGTGTSTGLPLTPCLTLSHSYPEAFTSHVPRPISPPKNKSSPPGHYDPAGPWPKNIECACCRSAVDPDVPEGWKNKRGNTSAVIRRKGKDGRWKNILLDCGKTFQEQARTWFPRWGVQTIDAVLLTHGHADAYFGLDDLREWCVRQRGAIPVYLDRPTYDIVARSFPYLVDSSQASGGGDVPKLVWNIIDEMSTFEVCGMNVKAYPTHHGVYFTDPTPKPPSTAQSSPVKAPKISVPVPLICLAFMFDDKVLYMGDVSEIPEKTYQALGVKRRRRSSAKHGPPTPDMTPPRVIPPSKDVSSISWSHGSGHDDSTSSPSLPVFVCDALWPFREHASHFGLAQAVGAALELRPSATYTIGSTHPTTHFMWEEICRSFRGEDGKRPNHPDAEISRGMVERAKTDSSFNSEKKIGQRWREWGGVVEPGYDGLVLRIDDDGKCEEVAADGQASLRSLERSR